MIRSKKLISFILLLILAGACSTEETISPVGKAIRPVILGEANPADSINIKLFMVQNTPSSNISSVIPLKAEVKILTSGGKTLTKLRKKDSIFWHAPNHLIAGEKYTLDILTDDNNHIIAQTSIPEPFHASIENTLVTENNRINLSVRIADKDIPGYFIVKCVKKSPTQSSQKTLFIESQDTQTDNYIYNELPTPTQYLFLRKKEKQQVIKLNIPAEDNCYLQIKKVDPLYYKYLYACEVQHSNNDIPGLLIANSSFLGIWGGCNTFSIPLSE